MSFRPGRWQGLRMFISLDRSGGYEDVLRALGAVLDEHQAVAVSLSEIPTGLLVRAQVPAHIRGDPLQAIETVFTSPAVLEAQVEAVMRRATGHKAGLIERALRVVGRQIDERQLRNVSVVQGGDDGEWAIRHNGIPGGRAELLTLSSMDVTGYRVAGLLDRGWFKGMRR